MNFESLGSFLRSHMISIIAEVVSGALYFSFVDDLATIVYFLTLPKRRVELTKVRWPVVRSLGWRMRSVFEYEWRMRYPLLIGKPR